MAQVKPISPTTHYLHLHFELLVTPTNYTTYISPNRAQTANVP